MSHLLRIFPLACVVLASLSVLADVRGLISFAVWGTVDVFDVTQPFGFQALMLTIRAIIQSLQWVAYGAIAELLIRQLYAMRAFEPRPLSLRGESDINA